MIELPKYKVILADAPWRYAVYSRDTGLGRSADSHYSTLKTPDIMDLPVHLLADKDCALFHWVTSPMLQEGMETLKRWGFTYKTVVFNWFKTTTTGKPYFGMGFHSRSGSELCLLGTRGHPKRISASVRQCHTLPNLKHSAKPPEFRDLIVELMGDVPRIELFARETDVPGWRTTGLEADGVDIRDLLASYAPKSTADEDPQLPLDFEDLAA